MRLTSAELISWSVCTKSTAITLLITRTQTRDAEFVTNRSCVNCGAPTGPTRSRVFVFSKTQLRAIVRQYAGQSLVSKRVIRHRVAEALDAQSMATLWRVSRGWSTPTVSLTRCGVSLRGYCLARGTSLNTEKDPFILDGGQVSGRNLKLKAPEILAAFTIRHAHAWLEGPYWS
jgi:hypothetical protein